MYTSYLVFTIRVHKQNVVQVIWENDNQILGQINSALSKAILVAVKQK